METELNRLYGPGLIFSGLAVPVHEMARAITNQVILAGVLSRPLDHVSFTEDDGVAIVFPCNAIAHLRAGIALMEYFHRMAEWPNTPEEGNEFLTTCFPEKEASPAQEIRAGLFLSEDDGKSWTNIRQFAAVSDPARVN